MFGLLAALTAKLAGVGTAAKAVAASTAAVTAAVAAGAAAGIVPMAGANVDPGTVARPAIEQVAAAVSPTTLPLAPTTTGAAEVQAEASVTPSTESTSAEATSGLAPPTDVDSANIPAVPALPTIPLPVVPSCVTALIPTGGTVPDPAQLAAQLPACILSVVTANLPLDAIESAIDAANLPVDVAGCLSSVISSIPGFVGGDLTGLSQLLSACLPTGSLPGTGSFPGM
ncbi:MAG: hypothetical protein H0V33_06375, partial [Acidimicrobiia bacterium]|nr:hypothetical protein [Acidimicrobiia bacterium]